MQFDLSTHQLAWLLADMAIKATILLALVAVVVRLFTQKRPAWTCFLWTATLAVLPVLPLISAAGPDIRVPTPAFINSRLETWDAKTRPQPAGEMIQFAQGRSTAFFSSENGSILLSAPVRNPVQDWLLCLAILYLTGVLLSWMRIGVGLWQAHRLQRYIRIANHSALNYWRQRLGVRTPVALGISTEVQVPAIIGFFKPVILIPQSIYSNDEDGLDDIIIHELAHIKRRDPLFNLLALAIISLYWFHPLVYWAKRSLDQAREYTCDDWAVSTTGDAHVYSSILLKVAANLYPGAAIGPAPQMANTSDISDRIERLIYPLSPLNPHVNRSAAASVTILILALACCLACSRTDQTDISAPTASAKAAIVIEPGDIFAFIDRNGDISINHREVDREHLREELQRARKRTENTDRIFLLVQEEEATLRSLVEFWAIARQLGFVDQEVRMLPSIAQASAESRLESERRFLGDSPPIIIDGDESALLERGIGIVDEVIDTEPNRGS